MKASNLDRLPLPAACYDHRVEAVLNSREHLRVALENLDNLRVRLCWKGTRTRPLSLAECTDLRSCI